MTDENELIKLREELKQIQEGTRRSRHRAAFGFVILVFALILCVGYGFVQQVAATKNAEEAQRLDGLVERALVDAEQNALEARRQAAIAMEQTAAGIRARDQAVAAVAECERRLNTKSKGK